MYVYEGEDYSKCSDEDKKSFDQLLAGIIICLSFRCTISIFFLHWDWDGEGGNASSTCINTMYFRLSVTDTIYVCTL